MNSGCLEILSTSGLLLSCWVKHLSMQKHASFLPIFQSTANSDTTLGNLHKEPS